jgi:hypothetical protein
LFVETAGFFDEAVTGQRKADLVGELTGWRGPLDEAARLVAVPEASAVRPRPQPRRAAPVRPQPRFTRPKSPSPVAADTSATSVIASAGEPASGFLGPERPGDLIQLERDVERRRRELNDLTVAVEEHLRGLEAAAEAARRGDRWKRLAGEDLVSVPLAEPSRLLPAEADRLARRLARSGLGNDGRLAQAMLALAMPAVDAASIGTGGPISTAVSRSPSSDRAPERGAAGAPSSAGAGLPGSAAVREAELLLGIDEMMRRRRDNVAWKRLDFADQVELVREVLALAALAAERGVAQGDRLARQRADRREERREIEAWFVARPQTWVEARRVGLPVDEWRAVAERRRRALEATVDARTPRRGLEL